MICGRTIFLLSILLLLIPLPVDARSLDCRGDLSQVEQAICSDPELSALEAEMDELYRIAQECNLISRDQARWLRRRDRTCAASPEAACLAPLYRDRITLLDAMLASSIRCDESPGERFLVLEGRWKVEPLRQLVPDGFDRALAVPFGTTVRFEQGTLCQTPPKDGSSEECAGTLIVHPGSTEEPIYTDLRQAMKAHGLGKGRAWIMTHQFGMDLNEVFILQQDGTVLEWNEEFRTFSIWRPLDGGGYRVVSTEGPVN